MISFKKFTFFIIFILILAIVSVAAFTNKHPNQITPLANVTNTPLAKKCPTGFILIPGNPLYKTSDFCVMKYDAKCADNTDLTKGLEPTTGSECTNEGTYKNNSPACFCTGSRQIVSTASGFPITYITESDNTPNNAIRYCQQQGWHLMTNPEWMTIARNVEKVANNWCDKNGTNCGFTPGAKGKILANGHNDNSSQALVASVDNQPCFGTTTDGSNQCGGPSSQKRTLTLSNDEIIWDLAGNVWQWVDATILRQDQPQSYTGKILDQGWVWSEFAPGAKTTVITSTDQGPSDPTWNSTNGVGRIYHYSGPKDNDTTAYTFIRGGNWRHGYDSGAFCVHLSPVANKENIDDVGFRCVADLK